MTSETTPDEVQDAIERATDPKSYPTGWSASLIDARNDVRRLAQRVTELEADAERAERKRAVVLEAWKGNREQLAAAEKVVDAAKRIATLPSEPFHLAREYRQKYPKETTDA